MTQHFLWLSLGSFLLGACPFSVWVGRLCLHKDIRRYGDGNPGAVNVFRAGNPLTGMVAVLLDIGKGIPFVWLAWHTYHLAEALVMFIALMAVLGHAFSPFLRFRGGKAVAVTFGVLIALGHPNMLFPFALAALLGFLILESDAWIVMLAPVTTLAFLILARAGFWPVAFIFAIGVLFYAKQAGDLAGWPRLKPELVHWLQSRFQA